MSRLLFLILATAFLGSGAKSAISNESTTVFLLPMSCAELLPDSAPFLGFFEAVGKGAASKERSLSRRIFRVLALREKLADSPDRVREQNPVDVLIRKTLCYYREQKAVLQPVGYDDPAFVQFLKNSIQDLEGKVDDTIYDWELDRQQRVEYRRQLERNRSVVDAVRREAGTEASKEFERLSSAARRKIRQPE